MVRSNSGDRRVRSRDAPLKLQAADANTTRWLSVNKTPPSIKLDAQEESHELEEMRQADELFGEEAESAQQPLIAATPGDHNDDHPPSDLTFKNAGSVIRFLTLSAGISGLLFGFDTGVISSTLVSIGSDLSNRPLTIPDKSVVTAITSLLALVSAPWTGYFADRYGRKSVIFVPALFFVVGAVIQALARYVRTMVVGRALVGAAVGIASGAVPLYITELAPASLRGQLVTVQSLLITGGQVVAYLVGWIFAYFPHGWRWMVGVGAVPAVVQLLLLLRMPETPRWLMQNGQNEKARDVLMKIYCGMPDQERERMVQMVISSVQAEITAEDKAHSTIGNMSGGAFRGAVKDLLSNAGNRRALIIACMLQGLQQLCGFNSLMYFSATIFALVGFRSPIATSLSIALTNFFFTLVAFASIDTVGRRNILLRSLPFMVLGLCACSISFAFIDISDAQNSAIYDSPSNSWPIVLLISMILYVAAYAVGLGCVPWQQSELFALRVRSFGSGLATATNWGSNFVIGMTFLPMMGLMGASTTFAVYACICAVGWFTVWNIYPETAGMELEDTGELLKDGWNVQQSVRLFQERRRARDTREVEVSDAEQGS